MRIWIAFGIAGLGLGMTVPVQAAEPAAGTGLSLLLGVDIGAGISEPSDDKVESGKSGYLLGGKALLSVFSSRVAADFGAGWFYNEMSGNPEPPRAGKEDNRYVRSRLGYGEVAARYRFQDSAWELGLVTQVLFGSDSSFSPFRDDKDKTANVLAGPQVVYAWKSANELDNRLSLQLLTDVSISARQVSFLTVGYAFGIPLVKPGVRVEVRETVKQKVVVQERVRVERQERYILDAEFVNFETDRYDLSPRAQEFLKRLGSYLAAHGDVWESLILSGHTDSRGTLEHNQTLAENRTKAVAQALIAQGVPAERLKTRVYGPRVPVDNESTQVALARNRRVEMAFVGQTKVMEIRRFMERLKQQLNVPETCRESGGCN